MCGCDPVNRASKRPVHIYLVYGQAKEGFILKKQKLNYRFHDPNPEGAAANYIVKLFTEANMDKVERSLKQTVHVPEQREERVIN